MKTIRNRAQYFQIFRGKLSTKDQFLLDFAYDLTKYAHGYLDQVRDGGERYFNHPRQVSGIIATELNIFDAESHIATLLHDVSEDTHLLTIERVQHVFGKSVAKIVLAVTKQNFENKAKKDYLEDYFKTIVQTGWKACLVKCGDRIHNLRTLSLDNPKGADKVRKQIVETNTYFPQLIKKIESHNVDLAGNIQLLLAKEIKRLEKMLMKQG